MLINICRENNVTIGDSGISFKRRSIQQRCNSDGRCYEPQYDGRINLFLDWGGVNVVYVPQKEDDFWRKKTT